MNYYSLYKKIFTKNELLRFYWVVIVMFSYSVFESAGLSLIIPYIGIITKDDNMMKVVEKMQNYFETNLSHIDVILYFSIFYLILISIKSFLQFYMNYNSVNFCYNILSSKSLQLFNKYINQSYEKYLFSNTSLYVNNCTFIIDKVAHSLFLYTSYLSSLIMCTCLILLMLWKDFVFSMSFLLLFFSVGFLIFFFFKKSQEAAGDQMSKSMQNFYKITTETFSCFKEVKIYKKMKYFTSKYFDEVHKYSDALKHINYSSFVPVVVLEYLAVSLLLGVTLFFIFNEIALTKLVGPLIFYGAIARRLLPDMKSIFSIQIKMQQYVPQINLLIKELNDGAEGNNDGFESKTFQFQDKIIIKNLSYSYSNNSKDSHFTLNNINLRIKKNQSLAFVGPSGAGKSTLIDIIASLLEPCKGEFIIDGVEYPNLKILQRKIGYVPQDVVLLDDTIANNIAFGDEKIDVEKLKRVIKIAHVDEFLDQMPEKENTIVGERGSRISGGQKQRIGIARSLYFEPEILIFDEATSSLDTHSEFIIAKAIKEISQHMTVIAIAHRISTIKNFDQIYVLNQGEIEAEGTHDELMKQSKTYQKLNTVHHSVAVDALANVE